MRPLERDADDEAFFRDLTFPEEDRHLYTSAPWSGGYRWFRAENVVPLERWRRLKSRQLANERSPAS
jgi:hypothetical protein